MSSASESVIFCEGFYDRAFWAGWLLRLGCRDARNQRASGQHDPAVDPWGRPVRGGVFAYLTPSGRFVRVQPCGNTGSVSGAVTRRLKDLVLHPAEFLIDNRDDDADAAVGAESVMRARSIAEGHARSFQGRLLDPHVAEISSCKVAVILWSAPDPSSSVLPEQQTLERLVCAAIAEAWPERAARVADWLGRVKTGVRSGPKAFAWAHMAGYYPDAACDEFYQALWREEAIAAALERRLAATGAAEFVRALAA